jgi:hypothetical protein
MTSFMFDPSGKRLAAARLGAREDQIGLFSVADAREYRVLVCDSARHRGIGVGGQPAAVHPDGRLAALGMADGVALWDLETGQQVAFVNVPGPRHDLCFDGSGNLLTNAKVGSFRWPVRPDPAKPGQLYIGPPERLPLPAGDRIIATSLDGRVIAQATYESGGWVLSPSSPQPRRLESYPNLLFTDVSSDGRFVAFGGFLPRGNVYEATTGRLAWQSRADDHTYCRFSRDGCWLVTDNDGVRAYRVGTWEPGPRLGPGAPSDISPDGRLVVLQLPEVVYRLVEIATGRELARLEDPEQIAEPAVFTPDGTGLIVGAMDGLRIWDLRRIRGELTKLGLDWDAAPYAEAPEPARGPLEVRVIGAELVGRDPMALNTQAWILVTGPAGQRDPAKALDLIHEAIKLQPTEAMFLNTLGVVHYRNGLVKEAARTLEKSLAAGNGESDAFDLFFLAMCHANLGDAAKAKDCFDRAVKWVEGRKDLPAQYVEELKAFRAEAEEVLGKK